MQDCEQFNTSMQLRAVLPNEPDPGSIYEIALNRHFVDPTVADRATISDNYRQIRDTLAVRNYICNTPNICGTEQAGWGGLTVFNDDLIHVCRSFFDSKLDSTCRAIILIHEGAHDEGIDAIIGTPHSPNRGEPLYPAGNVAPPGAVTTADRMDNPDAYAFFAGHIWRETDTGRSCFSAIASHGKGTDLPCSYLVLYIDRKIFGSK